MTSRDELVDLITSTAVDALDWHWDERQPYVLSPEQAFRHVAEAIYEALPLAAVYSEGWSIGYSLATAETHHGFHSDEAKGLANIGNPYAGAER